MESTILLAQLRSTTYFCNYETSFHRNSSPCRTSYHLKMMTAVVSFTTTLITLSSGLMVSMTTTETVTNSESFPSKRDSSQDSVLRESQNLLRILMKSCHFCMMITMDIFVLVLPIWARR